MGGGAKIIEKKKPADVLSGYRQTMSIEEAVRKSTNCNNLNSRNKIRRPRDLNIFANSEFRFTCLPIATALPWGNGGREMPRPKALTMIFTIFTHFLNSTNANNYFVRTGGRWFCLYTTIQFHVHLAHMGTLLGGIDESNPLRASGISTKSFRL